MKTIEIKLFHFEELTEEVQQKIIEGEQSHRYEHNHPWEHESRATLDAFCELFPVKWESYDEWNIHWSYTGEENHEELKGTRLMSHLWNEYQHALYKGKYYSSSMRKVPVDTEHPAGLEYTHRRSRAMKTNNCCVLTGYCMDDDILAPIYEVLDGKNLQSTFKDVLGDCMESFRKSWQEEQEHWSSEECIREELQDDNSYYEQDSTKR